MLLYETNDTGSNESNYVKSEFKPADENGQVMEEVIWLPEADEEEKSLLRSEDDDALEVISHNEDDESESESDEDVGWKIFPAKIIYFDKESKRNHKYIHIASVTPEEDEDVDILSDSDSDIEEIKIIDSGPIEIPDDDDDDEVMLVSAPMTNGTGSYKKTTDSSHKANGESSSSEVLAKVHNNEKPQQESGESRGNSNNDSIILSPNNVPPPKLMMKAKPVHLGNSILIGGVTKLVNLQDLKQSVVPNRSLLNNGIATKSLTSVANKVVVCDKKNQVVLKAVTGQQSLLKNSQTRVAADASVMPKQNKARKSITTTADIEPPGYTCEYCGFCYSSEVKLRLHIESEHPQTPQKRQVIKYSKAEMEELERELKDQSKICSKCKAGANYLQTVRKHASIHPICISNCDACTHGMGIIKYLMNHLEGHAFSADSD